MPTPRTSSTDSAAPRRRLAKVAVVSLSGAAALGVGVVMGFPALGLDWQAQRLALVLLVLVLPGALMLAWAGDAARRAPRPDPEAAWASNARTAWRRIQAEFFRLMDLHPETRETSLADLAEREPGLAEEVAALLEAHEGRGPLEELGDRIAGAVPGARPHSDGPVDGIGPDRGSP